jgi:hypothetical protein
MSEIVNYPELHCIHCNLFVLCVYLDCLKEVHC